MKINLIAGPNQELLMTHDDGKRLFPIVIGTFAGSKEVVPIAQQLMLLYNNQQDQMAPDNVVAFKSKPITPLKKEDTNNAD